MSFILSKILVVDYSVNNFFVSATSSYPVLINIFSKITFFGSFLFVIYFLVLISAICLTLFALTDNKNFFTRYLLPVWLSIIISSGITYYAKIYFDRAGPTGRHLLEIDPSFPSGHATFAMAFFGIIYFLFKDKCKNNFSKNFFLLFTIFMIFLIGLSRLVLNVHFLSDVLVGYLVGIFGMFWGIWEYKKTVQN